MGKLIAGVKRHARLMVQLGFTAAANGYIPGFIEGKIYTGASKVVCVPGLNCYSCPGALGSCPIGSLQAVLSSRSYSFSFYVAGILIVFGAMMGRFVCGWLCPFGLIEDLLFKIPFIKKLKKLPGDKWLKYLKYGILLGFVILLPLLAVDIVGQGQPWFCKYICPSGTLMAGVPLVSANADLQSAAGGLFAWKIGLLLFLTVLSIVVYRPFCRYLCPLGAIYGLFNKVALYRFSVDKDKCVGCKACQRACKLDIPVYERPNSPECIRCGECRKSCPNGAICTSFERAASGRASSCRAKKQKAQAGKSV